MSAYDAFLDSIELTDDALVPLRGSTIRRIPCRIGTAPSIIPPRRSTADTAKSTRVDMVTTRRKASGGLIAWNMVWFYGAIRVVAF